MRSGHERLLRQPHRLISEDPEPLVPERVNGADRVHRYPAHRPVSLRFPLTPAGPTWQVTALSAP